MGKQFVGCELKSNKQTISMDHGNSTKTVMRKQLSLCNTNERKVIANWRLICAPFH